jgi:hypothetical protein
MRTRTNAGERVTESKTALSRLKQGFDSPRAGTDIFYNDPATGTQVKMKVVDFVALYDGAANWTNNIIHNP